MHQGNDLEATKVRNLALSVIVLAKSGRRRIGRSDFQTRRYRLSAMKFVAASPAFC